MNGYEYERACAEYLRKKGFRDVSVTQASRDRGADIIAFRKKEKYAVQCKYYQSPVGNKAVQEIYAAATFYGCDRAVVMTNSAFTKGAIELAESLQVELMPGVDFTRKRFGIIEIILLLLTVALCGTGYIIAVRPELPETLSFLSEKAENGSEFLPVIAAGIGCSVLCLIWRLTRKPYKAKEVPVKTEIPEDSSLKKETDGAEENTDASSEPFATEEFSVLYDLINIAEQSFRESEDAAERESIRETLENAYSILISHEEELPAEWESPSERWEQLRNEER